MYTFECIKCGLTVSKRRKGQFCTQKCANSFSMKKRRGKKIAVGVNRKCRQCSIQFSGTSNQLYCSIKCMSEASFKRGMAFASQIKRRYGLTIEQYTQILDSQNQVCAICLRSDVGRINSRRLFVDHDHKTGRVRGILCYKCNTLIGHALDSPEILKKAIVYLEAGPNPSI